ncbi:MAG: hypothetical protein P4L36_08970 [Holophaga sp.]|nr:hypothetical protein [Holophaga sp.]
MAYLDGRDGIMFSTTLRITDDLAAFLQHEAQAEALSVNAFLSRLLERERQAARLRRLAKDWETYAADGDAQDVEYARAAQMELAAEEPVPYRAEPGPAPVRKGKRR